MGLDYNVARAVLFARRMGADFGTVLTLGRQNLNLRAKQVDQLLREFDYTLAKGDVARMKATPYCEDFLKFLGAEQIDSMDISSYEGATILHDLNQPVPRGIHQSYDTIIDGGVTGHIYNFPVLIKNCMDMLKVGGSLVAVTYANNCCGDGFYQLSPETYFSILSANNGFRMRGVFLAEVSSTEHWFRAASPTEIGRRVTLVNDKPTYILVLAEKIAHMAEFPMPQQSDYVALWANGEQFSAPRQPSVLRNVLKQAIPDGVVSAAQAIRHRWEIRRNRRLKAGRFYRPFDPATDSVL